MATENLLTTIDGDVNKRETKNKYTEYLRNPNGFSKEEFLQLFESFKGELNEGRIRVAEKIEDDWRINHWVKQLILCGFKFSTLKEFGTNCEDRYFEKETLDKKKLNYSDRVRVVSNNVTIRNGSFIAPRVICMPPSFINIGAYIDEDTLIDSNTLVGSCAQIGRRVHLSAGTQIGGVLEPIGDFPVIIEDNVFVGGNCGIYDGAIIKKGAIIGAGTIITGSISIYDIVHNKIYSRTKTNPLIIPEGAVIVPGARAIKNDMLGEACLSLQTPVTIKYIDTENPSLRLEDILRN